MTNSKNTKRALLTSILSMIVCCAMLIGSTFAWFTDSVTSGNNKIVAGNLDIELEYAKPSQGNPATLTDWETVEGATDIFNPDALWEPGHAEVVYLRLSNNGNLAFDYKFAINAKDNAVGTNADGEKIKLSDYLDFAVIETEEIYATREEAIAAAEEVGTKKISEGYSDSEVMYEDDEAKTLAMVVYMPTTVGNEANGALTLAGQTFTSSVDLSFSLVATQTPHESDSFGNDYDEFDATTLEELSEAISNAEAGDTIRVSPLADLKLTQPLNINKAITVDFSGAAVTAPDTIGSAAIQIATDGVTVKNAVITATSGNTDAKLTAAIELYAGVGDVTIDGCEINGSSATMSNAIWVNGNNKGDIVIRNCTYNRAINLVGYNNTVSNVTIEKNTFSGGWDVYGLTLSGSLHNISIRDNNFKSGGVARIHADGADNFDFKNVVLEGNTGVTKIKVDDAVKDLYATALENGGITIK